MRERNVDMNASQAVNEWKLISQSSRNECGGQESVLPEGQLANRNGKGWRRKENGAGGAAGLRVCRRAVGVSGQG